MLACYQHSSSFYYCEELFCLRLVYLPTFQKICWLGCSFALLMHTEVLLWRQGFGLRLASEWLVDGSPRVQVSSSEASSCAAEHAPRLRAWNRASQRAAHLCKFSSEFGSFSHSVLKGRHRRLKNNIFIDDWRCDSIHKMPRKAIPVQFFKSQSFWGLNFHYIPEKNASLEQTFTLTVIFLFSQCPSITYPRFVPSGPDLHLPSLLTCQVSWATCRSHSSHQCSLRQR